MLAPGSNAQHYDHMHVDLMRRASQRVICEPAAVSGEEIAARAGQRRPYASREPFVTGSLGNRKAPPRRYKSSGAASEEDEFEDEDVEEDDDEVGGYGEGAVYNEGYGGWGNDGM